MSLIAYAVRGRRVHVVWALVFLGWAGLNAAVLLHGDAFPVAELADFSHAPPPAQINTRPGAASADDRPPKPDSLPGERLTFSTTRLDLGDGKPNEIVRGELTLTNPNSSPVAFSLIKHCGCTELSPMAGTLPPSGTETISVGVKLRDHADSEKNTSIEVQTGEPLVTVARCVLSAHCPAPFQITPSFISFGQLSRDDLGNEVREIHLEPLAGRAPIDLKRIVIDHPGDAFRVEHAMPPSHGLAILRVSPKQDLLPGDHYDSVALRHGESQDVMRVSIHATVVEPISVVPGTLLLRDEGDFRALGATQLLVIARPGHESLLSGRVSLAEGPPGVRIDDLGAVGANRRRIRVSLEADRDALPRETQVWLQSVGGKRRFAFKLVKSS